MEIYRRYGIEPIINASGTVTRLGGAGMSTGVVDAWTQAARATVPLDHLQAAASRRIAARCGVEAGLVVGGAAAGLLLGTAAILAGPSLARMEQLPDVHGVTHELIVARAQRNGYDHAVRTAGARLVEVGMDEIAAGSGVRATELWEYEAAIGPQTAGVMYTLTHDSRPHLADVVTLAHHHSLPVLVDAAAQLPPVDNLHTVCQTGADLVVFSGGKALGGPQSTGILCGRRDLIGSAFLQMMDSDERFELWDPPAEFVDRDAFRGLPRQGIGRVIKVAKEEIVALLTALDEFTPTVIEARVNEQLRLLSYIQSQLTPELAETTLEGPPKPTLRIRPAAGWTKRSVTEICQRLRAGAPPIYLGTGALDQGLLTIHPACLDESSIKVLTERLITELT